MIFYWTKNSCTPMHIIVLKVSIFLIMLVMIFLDLNHLWKHIKHHNNIYYTIYSTVLTVIYIIISMKHHWGCFLKLIFLLLWSSSFIFMLREQAELCVLFITFIFYDNIESLVLFLSYCPMIQRSNTK